MKHPLHLAAVLAAITTTSTVGFAQVPPLPPQAEATVHLPDRFDTSTTPLRDLVDRPVRGAPRGGRDFEPGRTGAADNLNPNAPDPLAANGTTISAASVSALAYTDGTAVDPARLVAPPDTTGDLGPNHYVQWVNLRYAIYAVSRTAGAITGFTLLPGFPKNGNAVFQGFGGACETYNDGDPVVQYDQFNDRWVLTQFAVTTTPYTQCVAVSTSPDPTGTYHRYAYTYKDFNDYGKMGVWADGYYITYNMFRGGGTFSGSRVCALERDKMLVGQAARQICAQTSSSYGSLLPADIEGTGAGALPPAGTPNYLLSIQAGGLNFWRFSVNWARGRGTLTGPTAVSVASYSYPCSRSCIPQPGTATRVDALSDRLMYRLSYRNFGTRQALLVNHSVGSGGVMGVRWYELDVNGTATPTVRQQGTYQPDTNYRWMGSAAMDKTGGIAIGYSVSSTSLKPSVRYAFRAPTDPAGALGQETEVLLGTGAQTGSLSRWGDYSMMSVDPVDGCTMVFTTEYIPTDGSFNWATLIQQFKLSTCQ